METMGERLTDQLVKSLRPPATGSRVTWDQAVRGFGLCTTKTGSKSFVVNYRRKSDGRERRIVIGSYPDWGVAAARDEAKRLRQRRRSTRCDTGWT
jgi:Arm DNA-binding domain